MEWKEFTETFKNRNMQGCKIRNRMPYHINIIFMNSHGYVCI